MDLALKIAIGLFALLFLVLGGNWMFMPVAAAEALDISLGSAAALNTARGDVGGLFVSATALLVTGLRTGDGRWFQAVAVMLGAVAVGRVVGIVTDGFAAASAQGLTVEIVMIAVLLFAASRGAAHPASGHSHSHAH